MRVLAYSEAQKEATARYNKKAYDRIDVVVPKGRRKVIADYAKAHGKTTNKFIVEAIDRAMEESRRFGQDNGPDRAAGTADECAGQQHRQCKQLWL